MKAEPSPEWFIPITFSSAIPVRQGEPLTWLLVDRQIDAESRQTCSRRVVRLDSMESVQHHSQWRLQFEPRTQVVVIHWIRIIRGEAVIDHLNLDRVRILQREEGLEGLVIDGWSSALLVIEDVRPGDILDCCHSVIDESALFKNNCSALFSLPPSCTVAEFHFSVVFDQSRPLKWLSSGPELKPETRADDRTERWTWSGKAISPPKPEPNTPAWHIEFLWIQISDHTDWGAVAKYLAEAWPEEHNDPKLNGIVRGIETAEAGLHNRVESIIRLVQDEHRYLSVNLEHGGQIPERPSKVAARRYGDCKDLGLLLVHLLRIAGVDARPILVNTILTKSTNKFLPMPGLFNHVVVEIGFQGQTRWIDPTIKHQGGGPLGRSIPNYGFGLPLDAAAGDLVPIPPGSTRAGTYKLTEQILLDTTGAPSLLSVLVATTGLNAESLRHEFANTPLADLSAMRDRDVVQRYGGAKRVGTLKHRYDRETNEFFLAQVFEVTGFLRQAEVEGYCRFFSPEPIQCAQIGVPEDAPRRCPFELPHPSSFEHTIMVESDTFRGMDSPRYDLVNDFFRFNRRIRNSYGYWSMTLTLATLTDAVQAHSVGDYRRALAEVWSQSAWSFIVPLGASAPRRRSNWGELPATANPSEEPIPSSPSPAPVPEKPIQPVAALQFQEPPREAARSRRRSSRSRKAKSNNLLWILTIAGLLLFVVAMFVLAAVFGG